MRPDLLRPSRYTAFALCIALLAAAVALASLHSHPWDSLDWAAVTVFAVLCLVGVHDILQRQHSILRNYPVIGHIRWMAELIRPEIRQYLIEADEDAAPFSRSQRSLVYQRAKGDPGERPFGTLLDTYRDGYEFVAHSMMPAKTADPATFRID